MTLLLRVIQEGRWLDAVKKALTTDDDLPAGDFGKSVGHRTGQKGRAIELGKY